MKEGLLIAGVASMALPSFVFAYDSPANVQKCYDPDHCDPVVSKACGGLAPDRISCSASYAAEETLEVYGCGYTSAVQDLTNGQIEGETLDAAGELKFNWACLITLGVADPNAPVRGDDFGPEVKKLNGMIVTCPPLSACRDFPSPVGLWESYVQAS